MNWDPITRSEILLRINNAIINQMSRESLSRTLASEVRRAFHYDRFSINIYDSEAEMLRYFAVAEGINPEAMRVEKRSLSSGQIARAVIVSKAPLIIPDMSLYSHWETVRVMMDAGLKATIAVPLIVRNNVLGSLHFSFRETPLNINELAKFLEQLSGQVALSVDNMLAHTKLRDINANLEQQKRYLLQHAEAGYHPDNFFYSSMIMKELMHQVRLLAESDANVLITGETGTGKDYIARCIHHMSKRRDALFVKVNCPGLASTLFESELFGHAKGAFTGAHTARVGRFEMANGGTVFLDEIGDLPLTLQSKLLQVLQDHTFERVGDSRAVKVNFRLLSATNVDLSESIRKKSFRSDLFYRLNTLSIYIPPLRERKKEIPLMVKRLTETQSDSMRRNPPSYSSDAMEALCRHSWPGNVRELQNLITRLIILRPGDTVQEEDIRPLLTQIVPEAEQADLSLAGAERRHISKVLAMTGGAVGGPKGAAAILKVPRSTLQYRMRKFGLDPSDFSHREK